MEIPLSKFSQLVGKTILDRGRSYFKNGHVTSFEELTPGEFESIVEGNEDYTVNITILNNNITDCSCTCPYDDTSVCKHIVAVILHLQQQESGMKQLQKKEDTLKKPVTKRKTVSEQVDEMLGSLSHDDLKAFVKEQCISDPAFRRNFLSGFLFKTSDESPEKYREQVKNILRSAKGRDRFINYSRTGMVGKSVNAMFDIAMRHVDSGNYMSACYICFPVAEELVKALDFADDSDGDIGGNIETAFDILSAISTSEITEEIREYLLDQLLKHYKKNIFSGWDWQTYLLDIAVTLVKTEKEAGIILSLLHTHVHSEFESEQMTRMEYELINKMKGEKEAEKFIEQNLDNTDLRRKAIEGAIKNNNFDKAKSLAQDGIKNDSEDKPGLAKEWYDWLLRISVKQQDREKIIEYARYLFIDGFRHDQDYYAILKRNIETSEWTGFVDGLIAEIRRKDHWSNIDVIGKIYIAEQWWERLLGLVIGTRHLPYIQHYEQYLSDKFPVELAELYEKGIIEYLKKMTGRDHYKEACRYMRRMIKLGAGNRVDNLIAGLRKEYPLRKALMDELNNI